MNTTTTRITLTTGETATILDAAKGWIRVRLDDGTERSIRRNQIAEQQTTDTTTKENDAMTEQHNEQQEQAAEQAETTTNEATQAAEQPAEQAEKKGYTGTMEALKTAKLGYIKGKRSLICGDEVSVALDGLTPAAKREVAMIATATMETPVTRESWDGLNGGQIAMNAANAVRRAYKAGLITLENLTIVANSHRVAEEPKPAKRSRKAAAANDQAAEQQQAA